MQLTRRDPLWPALVGTGLFAVTAVWGLLLNARTIQLDAPPLVGHWDVRLSVRVVVPVVAGLLLFQISPAVQALPWRRALLAAWGMAGLWAVALAATDGANGFTKPLRLTDDYLHDVGRVHGDFLRTFTSHVPNGPDKWTTHVGGHPPGVLLLLKAMDVIGLGGAWPEAVVFIAAGTSATIAVLLSVRAVAGEQFARRALPFVALAPGALWIATSADALFLGVTAWGLACCALGRAFTGGLILGAALFLSYGLLPFGLLALVLLRRPAAVLRGAVGVAVVFATFAILGFWWLDGLQATYERVHAGAGGYRPLEYFVFANLAAFAVAIGPAALVALRAMGTRHRVWLLVAPLILGLLVADVTGTMRGEVERIWLPYVPWVLVPTAVLAHPRRWLAVQLGLALTVQLVLRSKW